jgi:hypothetical protein
MKSGVAIALICCGALLILAPPLFSYLNGPGRMGLMSQTYSFACWATGTAMIGVAAVKSLTRESFPPDSEAQ